MTMEINSIYCFDFTKEIGYYYCIGNFFSEKMTYTESDIPTHQNPVNDKLIFFEIPNLGRNHIREYALAQFTNLNEITQEIAVVSRKYISIVYSDGSERYFTYNEQFFAMFKIAFLYKPQEGTNYTQASPDAHQNNGHTADDISAYIHTTTPSYNSQTTQYQKNYSYSTQQKSSSVPWKNLLWGIGILILVIIIIVIAAATKKDINTDENLTPVTPPASGTILSGNEVYNGSKITIHAANGKSCVVKLKNSSGTERISFYVRAGETVTVGVPAEYLYVYFASGDIWYGKSNLFGSETHYSKDSKICNFTRYTCEYTLYPVNNGNFSETPIDEDEFK